MCVWIPVTLIFFIAMCFLSACRATGTTQIVAWAGTLTLAYGMCLCFALAVACVNKERYKRFWSSTDYMIAEKVAHARATVDATHAAIQAAKERRAELGDS